MSLRAACGSLKVKDGKTGKGTVYIDINAEPNRLDSDTGVPDADLFYSREIGTGDFPQTKCKIVSLKDVHFVDRVDVSHGHDDKRFNLDDDFVPREGKDHLKIHWDAEGEGAGIVEISYMVIAEK